MTLAAGTTVGRYQILEPLGQGGMATVYKAFQPSLEREVALKVLRPGYAQDAEFRERFEREAKAIAKLRHPNIVQVFDFEIAASGEFVLAMEFLEGGTLKDRTAHLASEGRGLDPKETVRIIWEVADALSYAHDAGIVHRDVKPSNVMLAKPRDRAVVTDFGIARILGATSHTQTGVGIGTPEYMAPEQGQGGKVDHRADIYSLGAMAYELLVGRVPYTADTPLAVVIAHIKDPLPLPSKVNPTIGQGVERALLRALAKDPAQRYDSAVAFAEALRNGLAQDSAGGTMPTIVVRSAGAAATPGRTAMSGVRRGLLARQRLLFGGAVVLVAAVVTGAVVATNVMRAPVTGAPVQSSAPTQSGASAQPAASSVPPRGPLIWQAKLDGTESDVRGPATLGLLQDESASTVRYQPGAIEWVIAKPGGGRNIQLNSPVRESFVIELDIDAQVGGSFQVGWWGAGATPRYAMRIDTQGGRMWIEYYKSPTAEPLGPSVIADVRKGTRFTAALVVERTKFTAYAGQRKVVDAAPDGRIAPAALPVGLFFGGTGTETGSLKLTGIRLYESPLSSAVPKGELLWQAKLDGTDADVRAASQQVSSDPSAAEIRYVAGAIEYVVTNATGSGRGVTLNNPTRDVFVMEIDIDPRSAFAARVIWWDRGQGRYGASFDARAGVAQLEYSMPGSAPEPLAPSAAADGLRRGNPFTAAVVVERARFTAYLDGRQVAQAAPDARVAPAAGPITIIFNGSEAGTLRVTGIRMYELATK